MARKYKMRKIKPTLRKIKKALTEMWRKEYEEKYLKEQLMQNLKLYLEFPPIVSYPELESSDHTIIFERNMYIEKKNQNA